ncbi:MAG: radical SAM protein [Chloroflexus sp.]|nr:radical SAM protein [Chloroflexus sp.]
MPPAIVVEPDLQQKLAILSQEAADEVADPPLTASIQQGITHATGFLYNAQRSAGGSIRLFKVLQTNACRYSCPYCFTSCAIRRRRTTFKPDELATTFVHLHRQRQAEGLFLSSGIVPDADATMERMLATVERLRLRAGFRGYIHLKLIPGARFEYIERAVALADRVSLNLEAPNPDRLRVLAPEKEFAEAMWQRLAWARQVIEQRRAAGLPAARSITTQFVVGAAGESDAELLHTVAYAQQTIQLGRSYFSAFHPIERSPFSDLPAEDPIRAARLYQAEAMLREYGFSVAELPFDEQGNLPRDCTPKQAWAVRHLHEPVEVNTASLQQLLRVPGIGPRSAARIIAVRRQHCLRNLDDLRRLGVNVNWAASFVLLDGRAALRQLSLWPALQ